jgi:hypothetical protein
MSQGAFYNFVQLGFSNRSGNMAKMHARFFLDQSGQIRKAAQHLKPKMFRFLNRSGAAVRLAGRRQLKPAKQVTLRAARRIASQGKSKQRNLMLWRLNRYEQQLKQYRKGRAAETRSRKSREFRPNPFEKPQLPYNTALKGAPPLLHVEWDSGTSPLKHRLYYAIKTRESAWNSTAPDEVVIGPEFMKAKKSKRAGAGGMKSLRQLEDEHPFMVPAYKAVEPKFPEYLRQASLRGG